jgi:hypothetical protein
VKTLFERYVNRDFMGVEQHEYLMVREIREHLKNINVRDFKVRQIDDDLMPVRFPLVSVTNETHVIKPLAFDQKTPLAILDHEAQWRNRLEHLIQRGKLKAENILLPIEGPHTNQQDAHLLEAYDLARTELDRLNVTLVARDDIRSLKEFARKATRSSDILN